MNIDSEYNYFLFIWLLKLTCSAIFLTVSSLITVELPSSDPLRGTISVTEKKESLTWHNISSTSAWLFYFRYYISIRSDSNRKKPTCHFIFIRHLSGQLLHGNIIKRTQDDNGPFEISCKQLARIKTCSTSQQDCDDVARERGGITNLLWAALSRRLGICPEWWAAAGRHDFDDYSFHSFCSLWAPVVSRTQLSAPTPVSLQWIGAFAQCWLAFQPCGR